MLVPLLMINGDNINAMVPGASSTLYVTVGPWPDEDRRAAWLAEQVGLEIIGDAETL